MPSCFQTGCCTRRLRRIGINYEIRLKKFQAFLRQVANLTMILCLKVVDRAGFEPTTPWFFGKYHANQVLIPS
jgi:hypothetical protein